MSALSSWQFWAVLSAIFAALTAIFAKVGVENVNSDLATFIRTVVVIVTLGFLLAVTGEFRAPGTISGRTYLFLLLSGLGHRRVLALLLSRAQDRRGGQGRADRQIVGCARGDIRRDISRRKVEHAELAGHRADRGGRDIGSVSLTSPSLTEAAAYYFGRPPACA